VKAEPAEEDSLDAKSEAVLDAELDGLEAEWDRYEVDTGQILVAIHQQKYKSLSLTI
jgi:hypothetical protein